MFKINLYSHGIGFMMYYAKHKHVHKPTYPHTQYINGDIYKAFF